jgi:hypothetical protein
LSPLVPDPTPNPRRDVSSPDAKARRFGRAVILLGAVAAVILIALFISPKSAPRPQPQAIGGSSSR